MRKTAFIILSILICASAYAQSPKVNFSIDRKQIPANETAIIRIESEQPIQITPPQGDGFQIEFAGETVSKQISIVNFNMTSIDSHVYEFRVIPKKNGEIEIGAFEIVYKGDTFYTEKVQIQVVKAEKNTQKMSQQNQGPDDFFDDFFQRPRVPSLFLRLFPESTTVYQNQAVVINAIEFATAEDVLDSRLVQASPINSPKMSMIDISDTLTNEKVFTQNIQGITYYGKIIKRYVAFPMETGVVSIVPPSLVAMTKYGQIALQGENVGVNSIAVNAKTGFHYIGDLQVKMQVSTNRAMVGRALDVSMRFEGTGNISVFSNPYQNVTIDGLFFTQPQMDSRFLEWKNNKARFVMELRYSIIPQKDGEFTIPEVLLEYYDDKLNQKSVKLDAVRLRIDQKENANEVAQKATLKTVDNMGDYRFVMASPVSICFVGLFTLLPFVSIAYGRHQKRMQSDVSYSRKVLANRRLAKYLEDAKKYWKMGAAKDFYLAMQKGLFYYVADKFNLSQGIEYKKLVKHLESAGIDEDTISAFRGVLPPMQFLRLQWKYRRGI